MTLGSYTQQSPSNNLLADLTEEQDELTGFQGPAGRLDPDSNEALTPLKALTPLEALILSFVPSIKDLFTKFIKTFMESTQAWDREQTEPRKQPLKARSPKTYLGKFHIDCYHFYQQSENHFKILSATKMNCTPFTA